MNKRDQIAALMGPLMPPHADAPQGRTIPTRGTRQNSRGLIDYYLGPTGIPQRLEAVNQMFNPVEGIGQSMQASQRAFAPDTSPWGRFEAVGDMLSGVAGAAAPMVAASRVGAPAADAVVEAMTGVGAAGRQAAGEFAADESGALRLFHGSPHDFDKFSMDKIGTGEGAQAYGHGLYFAEDKGVADSYRKALAPGEDPIQAVTFRGAEMPIKNPETPIEQLVLYMRQLGYTPEDAFKRAKKTFPPAMMKEIEGLSPSEFTTSIPPKYTGDGRMYEVEVNANPEDFLDWDAPLSAQSGKAQEYVANMRAIGADIPEGDVTGADLYKHFSDARQRKNGLGFPKDQAAATREFSREGIPGIRYLDAGSRGAGDVNELRGTVSMWERAAKKTPNDPYALQMLNDAKAQLAAAEKQLSRNYVVFDENLISIVRKYGIAGAAAMMGMSEADVAAAMEQQ